MKKTILSLMLAGAAGILVPASAQTAAGDNNTNTPAADQPGSPPPPDSGPNAGGPPDAGPGGAPMGRTPPRRIHLRSPW